VFKISLALINLLLFINTAKFFEINKDFYSFQDYKNLRLFLERFADKGQNLLHTYWYF